MSLPPDEHPLNPVPAPPSRVVPAVPPPRRLPSGNDPHLLTEAKSLGWNWGAFLVPYFWLLGHGQVSGGMLLLITSTLPLVAVLHFLIYPVTAFYLGLNGYELAWKNRAYHSVEQLRQTDRTWFMWGVVFFLLTLMGILFMLLYLSTMMTEMSGLMEEMGL